MNGHEKFIINFCSVRGGPGKTTIMIAFGIFLHKQGKKVLLIDFDILGPVLDILFKKREPEYTITDYLTSSRDKVLSQMKRLSKYIIKPEQLPYSYKEGFDIIFASREIRKMRKCYEQVKKPQIFDKFDNLLRTELYSNYDFILIDNSPGIQDTSLVSNIPSDIVLYFIRDRRAELEDLDGYFPKITRSFGEKQILYKIIENQSFESDINQYIPKLNNINIEEDILFKIPFYHDLRKSDNYDEVRFLDSNPEHPIYLKMNELYDYIINAKKSQD